jgi:glutamate synthase (NADPH/NADH) small chain
MMKPRFTRNVSGKNVVVVGSGPAGLTVADQLNHRGHSVTVIEKHPRAGGILTYGIPNMKLPKDVVQRRIELMTDEGVTFVTGLDASDPSIAHRLSEEYDAVVLCCGAEEPRNIGVDTTGVKGVYYAMEFLHAAVDRQQFGRSSSVLTAEGRNVIIIGTGNTASDCVSTSIRQGCISVTQLVRRGIEDYLDSSGVLPQDYAQEEAEYLFGRDPRLFGQSVASLQTDEAGNLISITTKCGDTLPCELLIGATGFSGCRADVCQAFGVEQDRTVKTEKGRFQTNVPHIFTAGDMHRGQSLVVHAIAEGRAAAIEVDRFLMGYTNLI